MSLVNDMLNDLELRRRLETGTGPIIEDSAQTLQPRNRSSVFFVGALTIALISVGFFFGRWLENGPWLKPNFSSPVDVTPTHLAPTHLTPTDSNPTTEPIINEPNSKTVTVDLPTNKRTEDGFQSSQVAPIVAETSGESQFQSNEELDSQATTSEQSIDQDEIVAERQQRIETLLLVAEQALYKDRLTTPIDDNALSRYQQILELSPDHKQALKGINRIIDRYQTLLLLAESEKNAEKIQRYRPRLAKLVGQYPQLDAARAIDAPTTHDMEGSVQVNSNSRDHVSADQGLVRERSLSFRDQQAV